MKRAFKILSLALASVVAALWLKVLTGNHRNYIEVPRSANHLDYIEGRRQTRFHLLLLSDRRGIVFDVFVRQLPPEKAPGPLGSDETQRWLKARAERAATAYARFFGFEKGIEHRHGQHPDGPLYFYGVDHYFAVPHLLLIVIGALPTLWPLRRYLSRRTETPRNHEQATRLDTRRLALDAAPKRNCPVLRNSPQSPHYLFVAFSL